MARRPNANLKNRNARRSVTALPKPIQKAVALGKRSRGHGGQDQGVYIPTEDWYEPTGDSAAFQVVIQDPGPGYQHVVTAAEVRQRLSKLPADFVKPLEVVQLSRMTKKKRAFPCYGMQWGSAIYLYPLEKELIEHFNRPPRPAEYHETRACGGRWVQDGSHWKLIWTPKTIRDFYLNNVLIHELGHLLDPRNTSYQDRERFAEWFASEHGVKPTRSPRRKPIRRRHSRK
jgi:hypothetical protein